MKVARHAPSFVGLVLLSVGLLGPFTFADDLRHSGEIAVSIGLTLAGVVLLAPRVLGRWRCGSSLPLAAPLVLSGLAAGIFMDKALPGLLLGACAGSIAIGWHCFKHRGLAT